MVAVKAPEGLGARLVKVEVTLVAIVTPEAVIATNEEACPFASEGTVEAVQQKAM